MTTTRTASKRHAAFTLVELLVVMAVISLLVALLLPALAQSRDVAIRTTCASQIRSITQTNITYASANSDYLAIAQRSPQSFVAPVNATTGASWNGDGFFQVFDYLAAYNYGLTLETSYEYAVGHPPNNKYDAMIRQPFAKFNKMRTCPLVMRNADMPGEDLTKYSNGFFSFGYNGWLGGMCRPRRPNTRTAGGLTNNYNTTETQPLKLSNVPRPSDCIMFTDVCSSNKLPGTLIDCKSGTANSNLATYNDVAVKTARPNLVGAEHGRVVTSNTYTPWTGAPASSYTPIQYGYVNIGCADGSVVTYFAKFDATNIGPTNGGTVSGGGNQWDGLYMDPGLQ